MNAQTRTEHDIVFFIDQEKFKVTPDHEYTVRELLELAGEDPADTTLVLRHGNDLTKFTDLDQVIEISNGTHFVVFHNGPTPVS